jgi:hypothetical protein
VYLGAGARRTIIIEFFLALSIPDGCAGPVGNAIVFRDPKAPRSGTTNLFSGRGNPALVSVCPSIQREVFPDEEILVRLTLITCGSSCCDLE